MVPCKCDTLRRHASNVTTGVSNRSTAAATATSASSSRRTWLLGTASIAVAPLLLDADATAATSTAWNFLDYFVVTPPEPVKFPRRTLDTSFAVLLMRSSYEAVDALNCIAMDQFQKQFWKFRQAEYESYALQYSPLKINIGELSDPLYFDFISFAQYATVSRALSEGQQVFKEYCEDCANRGDASPYVVVQRDVALKDNSKLPDAFYALAGDNMYDGLLNGFRGRQFNAPPPCAPGASFETVLRNAKDLLSVLVANGFALSATVDNVQQRSGGGHSFVVDVQGPANKWAVTALQSRRSGVLNLYDVILLQSFFRRSQRQATYALTNTENGYSVEWTVV